MQVARKAARRAGLTVYTGNLCKRCQTTTRYVSINSCWECHRQRYLASVGGAYAGRKGPKTQSMEARAAISRFQAGRTRSPETRAKMSLAATAREAARRQMREISHHV
jgi:hypothetical protein